ncbi:MAG: alpha/beta hydrolase [Myxococcales bacterium]|nr:alpha/beta hydrolase [Myxococcales bacterium]MCB9756153.1 alpha/beta hydrolase [Myxococcales bacterium]
MTTDLRERVADLRGATALAVEATKAVTTIVEDMHRAIADGSWPLQGPRRLVSRAVYGSIRGVTGAVGAGLDLALQQLAPALGDDVPGPARDALLSALNGVLGDYLEATENPLAITMRARHGGAALELDSRALSRSLPGAGRKLLVLVHGLTMSDHGWRRRGHDHGEALARDLGYTPVYLLYNTGRHISANGEALAELLDALVAAWPASDVELTIVAHSMGGLVARSACQAADAASRPWRRALTSMVFLGTPHHGAPLERGGSWVHAALGISRYSAPLARLGALRSAGITDLRHGAVVEADWRGRDRFEPGRAPRTPVALPRDVACFAIAGEVASGRLGALVGDGLVPVDSALGRGQDPEHDLRIPDARAWTAAGVGHLDLLSDAGVYERVRAWLDDAT